MEVQCETRDSVLDTIEAFYDRHPYPPPVTNLDDYRVRWQDEARRRADFHLHWSGEAYREGIQILVAGCGTGQAAKHALRQPAARVVGIDISAVSIRSHLELKQKYNLANLEVFQMPVEQIGRLGQRFDKVVCTGVIHHLADPEVGLRALREVLEPDGALNLMVYAAYGRTGIYMLQEYCRRLGIGFSEKEIKDLANTLTTLSPAHPLARLLGESPDFASIAGLADALLNPQDHAYTVPQLFDLLDRCGLSFSRWVRQAPYLPECSSLSSTPHASLLSKLPRREQYAAVELFRGTMVRHSLIAYREDKPGKDRLPQFDNDDWLGYIPIRLPDTRCSQKKPPARAAAVLLNQAHGNLDITLPVTAEELRLIETIDGRRNIEGVIQLASPIRVGNLQRNREQARSLFEKLYLFDQVVFQTSDKVR